jgi:hypothetical protein
VNLKNLSDELLVQTFSDMVVVERKHSAEIIGLIHEIDRRRLYLKVGFASLFQYLTESFGYTPGSAQRRIDAARMLGEVPEIKESIRNGEINLMQVATLARSVREREKSAPVLPQQKREILNVIKNQDLPFSERAICQMLEIQPKLDEKKTVQMDGSIRMQLTFTKEQVLLIEQAREALSHIHPHLTMTELFTIFAERTLRQKGRSATATAKMAVKATENKFYISRDFRRRVFREEKCCQWRNRRTGKICGSKFQLQVDHIQPLWAGGTSQLENLQLLCAVHNRLKYREEAGIQGIG